MHCNGNRLSRISAGLLVKINHNPDNNSFHKVTLLQSSLSFFTGTLLYLLKHHQLVVKLIYCPSSNHRQHKRKTIKYCSTRSTMQGAMKVLHKSVTGRTFQPANVLCHGYVTCTLLRLLIMMQNDSTNHMTWLSLLLAVPYIKIQTVVDDIIFDDRFGCSSNPVKVL